MLRTLAQAKLPLVVGSPVTGWVTGYRLPATATTSGHRLGHRLGKRKRRNCFSTLVTQAHSYHDVVEFVSAVLIYISLRIDLILVWDVAGANGS